MEPQVIVISISDNINVVVITIVIVVVIIIIIVFPNTHQWFSLIVAMNSKTIWDPQNPADI